MMRSLRFPRHPASALALLFAMLWCWSPPAHAQVKRCTTDQGTIVYTDRPCSTIGASERLPRGAQASGIGARRAAGCARNLQDLIYEITAAVDQRDVNRLGAVYHWVGMNPESGYRVLDRLQAIVDRPLVDIVALRSAGRAASPTNEIAAPGPDGRTIDTPSSAVGSGIDRTWATTAPSTAAEPDENATSPPPRRTGGGPVGLRLEQTLRNSATPSRTVFGLRRHIDCWWVVLPAG